jgi:uncharacterized protein YecT (DUF1311 family)
MKKILCLAVFSLLSACNTSTKPASLGKALPNWSPELDEPILLLEELLDKSQAQQDMNYLATNLASLYDAKLWLAFQTHLDGLQGDTRNHALEKQRQWLLQRQKAIDEEYSSYEGGSGAPLAAARLSMEMTQKRLAILRQPQP